MWMIAFSAIQDLVRRQLIKLEVDNDVASVVAINKAHPLYRSHVVWEDEAAAGDDEPAGTCAS